MNFLGSNFSSKREPDSITSRLAYLDMISKGSVSVYRSHLKRFFHLMFPEELFFAKEDEVPKEVWEKHRGSVPIEIFEKYTDRYFAEKQKILECYKKEEEKRREEKVATVVG